MFIAGCGENPGGETLQQNAKLVELAESAIWNLSKSAQYTHTKKAKRRILFQNIPHVATNWPDTIPVRISDRDGQHTGVCTNQFVIVVPASRRAFPTRGSGRSEAPPCSQQTVSLFNEAKADEFEKYIG